MIKLKDLLKEGKGLYKYEVTSPLGITKGRKYAIDDPEYPDPQVVKVDSYGKHDEYGTTYELVFRGGYMVTLAFDKKRKFGLLYSSAGKWNKNVRVYKAD